jgi:hypothetical protein
MKITHHLSSADDAALHHRRDLLKLLGGALLLPLASCASSSGGGNGVNLGSGDTGLMNYALVLEGLEAAFYSHVMERPYARMSGEEGRILKDIRDHEIVHRDFFRAALGANAVPQIEYTFARVDFSSRASVLSTAQTFEDLGVAAYNGAGSGVKNPAILTIAGKIVSVEARHASVIRDLMAPLSGSFAPDALDTASSSREVLRKAAPFVVTKLNANHLPA